MERGQLNRESGVLLIHYIRFIRNVQILKPRLHTSDHMLVLGVLQSEPRDQGRKQFPLAPPVGPATRVDSLFDTTMNHVAKWISDGTWRVADKLADARRAVRPNQTEVRRLTRALKASFQEDQRARTRGVGEGIEALLRQKA
jgi:hypothetical protein